LDCDAEHDAAAVAPVSQHGHGPEHAALDRPVALPKVPAGQRVGAAVPPTQKYPSGHVAAGTPPAQKVPGAHGTWETEKRHPYP